MKKGRQIISLIIIIVLIIVGIIIYNNSNQELKTIKSEKQLYKIYMNKNQEPPLYIKLLTIPFSLIYTNNVKSEITPQWNDIDGGINDYQTDDALPSPKASNQTQNQEKDYSKTNIQVEGVDEADIIKTDGNYIYSISENNVVITNTENPTKIKIESKINLGKNIPTELLLYKDKLVIISTERNNTRYSRYNYSNKNTIVSVYNISNKQKPKKEKELNLKANYYTSRSIEGNLYIFSSDYLREKNKKIDRSYTENNKYKEIELNNIKYLSDNISDYQTLIAEIDLNNIKKDTKISSYLLNINNAYISKDNVYLIKENYGGYSKPSLKQIFGLKGIFGIVDDESFDYSYKTNIYKFNINKNKGITYQTKNTVVGNTINQYSLDENNNNLRIALETREGTYISILDKDLKVIGETEKVAEGETMYASRFMGDRGYLVTYENTDPLFVADLSNPKDPKILGELEIPGYSTYLHPYDENHLIGIGMDTKEVVHRDYNGRVTSTWTETEGMKMSLFDVSDIENPIQIDSTSIGNRRTVSAILSNPKALLFSKEKELIAIPVNNYNKDFSSRTSDTYEDDIERYNSNSNNYVSEGYLVYNINLKGFKLRGQIIHEKDNSNYYEYTKLLRGLYIENDLYTVSEDYIKVNNLLDLKEINSLKLKGEE